MDATHIKKKKIKCSMLCLTGVYLRDIPDTLFVILHLNVIWAFALIFFWLTLKVMKLFLCLLNVFICSADRSGDRVVSS